MTSIPQKKSSEPSNLVQCDKSHRKTKSKNDFCATVDVYAGIMTVSYKDDVGNKKLIPAPHGIRKPSTDFTPKSRNNMMRRMAKKSNYTRPLFLTLTYPDETIGYLPGGRDYKRDIDCFEKRLRREFPECGGIWRIEAEPRKSGALKGYYVPHFHVLIDGIMHDVAYLRKLFRQWWFEIITDDKKNGRLPRVDVQVVKSRRHAMHYINKYMSKETAADENSHISHSHKSIIGRHWAVFGNWQEIIVEKTKLTRDEFLALRRLAVRWLNARKNHYAKRLAHSKSRQGFSIFGLGCDKSVGQNREDTTIHNMLLFVTGIYGFR